jgi:hypothetical protein
MQLWFVAELGAERDGFVAVARHRKRMGKA